MADVLNAMDGDTKSEEGWKRQWDELRSEAKATAQSNSKPKSRKTGGGYSSSEDEDPNPTTNNDLLDRVLGIIGWECAVGVGIRDELSRDEDKTEDTGADCIKVSSIAEGRPDREVRCSSWEDVWNAFAANRRARSSLQVALNTCHRHVPLYCGEHMVEGSAKKIIQDRGTNVYYARSM